MQASLLAPSLVLAAALTVTPANAQEIEDNVPLDLVKALLANNNPFDVRLYEGVPDHFPDITIPDSAELLGSADMGHSQQIVMRAEGDGVQQRSQIIAALENQGYLMLTQPPGANMAQTGFVTPRLIPPGMPVQLCHDTYGMLTVRITGIDPGLMGGPGMGVQNVSLGVPVSPFVNTSSAFFARSPTSPTQTNSIINVTSTGGVNNPRGGMMGGQSCVQMQMQFSNRGAAGPAMVNLNQYMPRMELPPAATLPGMGPGMAMRPAMTSGSAAGMESRIDMSLDWELDALMQHFRDQIEQQDWERDHEVIGSVSATGSWTRQVDELQLISTLRVVSTGETQYQLQFSIQSLPVQ